ncbi:DCN1-like protein 4, partial [Cucurbita argyrosperma subsp. sororia]
MILAKVAPEASSPAWPTPSPRDIPITIPSSSSSPVAAALWAQLRRIDRLFDLFSGYNHVMEKMKAKKQGYFHRDEWRRGLRKLKVDNMEKLKNALFYLEIETQTMYRVLIMDQWMNIFYFCNQIKFPGLDNYDPNHAWPVIIDSFVEWLKRKQGEDGTHPS